MHYEKCCVYVLRSANNPQRHYVGLTADGSKRLDWHNRASCGHTAKYRPWSLVIALQFAEANRAAAFERYLKSGSGRAFAKRHFS
jgi:putative endonuclease